MPRCWISASAIWKPTGSTGLSEVIGSWKIMPMRLPRIACFPASFAAVMSTPSTTMRPLEMRPTPAGSRPMTDSAVRLLPQPDSPTRASVSRRRTSKLTSRTASCQWRAMRMEVVSPSTVIAAGSDDGVGAAARALTAVSSGRWRRAGRRRRG
jgi:hypothetical protein